MYASQHLAVRVSHVKGVQFTVRRYQNLDRISYFWVISGNMYCLPNPLTEIMMTMQIQHCKIHQCQMIVYESCCRSLSEMSDKVITADCHSHPHDVSVEPR